MSARKCVVGCIFLASLGGTSALGATVPNPGSPPAPIVVRVSPSVASVRAGGIQTFTVSISNTTNTSVIWQVDGVAGGNASVGTISSAGVYAAPPSLHSAAAIVTAVAAADPSRFGSASVILSLPISMARTLVLGIILSVLYWLGNVFVRWHRIAHPTRELLREQIYSLRNELELLGQDSALAKIGALLSRADVLVDDTGMWRSSRIADALFWSRGKELTGWRYSHQAEVAMAQFLPVATVVARLESNEQKLRLADNPGSLALANSIHEAIATPNAELGRLRALLAEALEQNYDREDDSFSDLANWQNKAAWLVVLGLFLCVVLAGLYPERSAFLIVGAVGGLLSRLARSLNRSDVPTDYGADWTTLFVSPVAGALGAWAGILLSSLAAQLNVLGSIFADGWDTPTSALTLGIALLFGFSEQLLDTVFDKLSEKSTGAAAASGLPPGRVAALPSGGGQGAGGGGQGAGGGGQGAGGGGQGAGGGGQGAGGGGQGAGGGGGGR